MLFASYKFSIQNRIFITAIDGYMGGEIWSNEFF